MGDQIMLKLRLKTLIVIFTVSLMSLVTTSCGSTTSSTTAVETTVEPAIDSEEELTSWDKYFLLSEKEQIKEVKESALSTLDYGTWDENKVLKFMSFICEDESSSYFPYGSLKEFIDTTKLTEYKSALITYYCIPGAGSSGVINIAVRANDKDEPFITNIFTRVQDYFGYEELQLKDNQIDFVLSGYSKSDLGLCCQDITDTGKIYLKDKALVMEFTSFNDYRIKIYNQIYGPVFESNLFQELIWGDNQIYDPDEIYEQSDKYKQETK
jgi:hypothetical protein